MSSQCPVSNHTLRIEHGDLGLKCSALFKELNIFLQL